MFRYESPMVAVATLTLPSAIPTDINTSFYLQFSLFILLAGKLVHSIFPLTHFTANAHMHTHTHRTKKSLFQFFTHSLRLITTPAPLSPIIVFVCRSIPIVGSRALVQITWKFMLKWLLLFGYREFPIWKKKWQKKKRQAVFVSGVFAMPVFGSIDFSLEIFPMKNWMIYEYPIRTLDLSSLCPPSLSLPPISGRPHFSNSFYFAIYNNFEWCALCGTVYLMR